METQDDPQQGLFRLIGIMAGVQTFFVMVMGAMVVFKSAEWVLLGCILLFSLVNLAVTLTMGNVVARTVESVKRQGVSIGKVEDVLKKMIRGPRSDGLVDVGDVVSRPDTPFVGEGNAARVMARQM